jgi:hypothetical protein
MNERERRIHNSQVLSALVMGLFYGGIMVIYFGGKALIGILALTIIILSSGFALGLVTIHALFFYGGIAFLIAMILLGAGYVFHKKMI